VDAYQARLRELPALVQLVADKFIEHDRRYQGGGGLLRTRRRAEVVVGAWGEMLAADVWTDGRREAVVCETPKRRKARFYISVLVGALLLSPLAALPNGTVVLFTVLAALVLPFVPAGLRDVRCARRHRDGTAVLTFLASRRRGAGRALLDARCDAADSRRAWLCLDAPAELESYYRGSGVEKVGDPEIRPDQTIIYMERAPRSP
jgi:hypothetical protein